MQNPPNNIDPSLQNQGSQNQATENQTQTQQQNPRHATLTPLQGFISTLIAGLASAMGYGSGTLALHVIKITELVQNKTTSKGSNNSLTEQERAEITILPAVIFGLIALGASSGMFYCQNQRKIQRDTENKTARQQGLNTPHLAIMPSSIIPTINSDDTTTVDSDMVFLNSRRNPTLEAGQEQLTIEPLKIDLNTALNIYTNKDQTTRSDIAVIIPEGGSEKSRSENGVIISNPAQTAQFTDFEGLSRVDIKKRAFKYLEQIQRKQIESPAGQSTISNASASRPSVTRGLQ